MDWYVRAKRAPETKKALLDGWPFPSDETTSHGPDEGWPDVLDNGPEIPDTDFNKPCPRCGAPANKACRIRGRADDFCPLHKFRLPK